MLGAIGAVQSWIFAAELGARAHLGRGLHPDLFVRVGISPTLLAQTDSGRGWSLRLPVFVEARRSTIGSDGPDSITRAAAVLTGLEVVHRGERRGWGLRLLVGRSGEWAYRWEFDDHWTHVDFELDTTDARLDLSLHLH